MSGFVEIIKCLGHAVTFIFQRTLDIIAFTCLLCSFALPWRFWEVYSIFDEIWDKKCVERMCISISMLFLTILDCLAVPVFFISFLSPFRWLQVRKYVFKYFEGGHTLDQERILKSQLKFRLQIFESGFGALYDLVCYMLGFIALLSPFGRQFALFQCLRDRTWKRNGDASELSESITEFSTLIARFGISTFIDFFAILPGFIISLLTPSIWRTTLDGFIDLKKYIPTRQQVHNDSEPWEDWFQLFRFHMLVQIPHALIDIFSFPLVLIACISPLRSKIFFDSVKKFRTERMEFDASEDLLYPDRCRNLLGNFDHHYRKEIRIIGVQLGFLGIADLLILPLLLPVWLSRYRFIAIRNQISFDTVWGFAEISLIFYQALLLLFDAIILLPTLPILYLTRWRWNAVKKALFADNAFLDKSFTIYTAAMSSMSLLIMDILLSPLYLIIFLTRYRLEPIENIRNSSDIWATYPEYFHFAIILNFLVIVHDVFIILPITLITCVLCFYRGIFIIDFVHAHYVSSLQKAPKQREISSATNLKPLLEGLREPPHAAPASAAFAVGHNEGDCQVITDANEASSTVLDDSAIVITTQDPSIGNTLDHQTLKSPPLPAATTTSDILESPIEVVYDSDNLPNLLPSHNLRITLWIQFLLALLDIPTGILGLIVVLTGWRASELFFEIRTIYHNYNCSMKKILGKYIDQGIRETICVQLILLIRDFFFIFPLACIVGTFYRLPGFVLDVLTKFSGNFLAEKTLFEIVSCRCEAPDVGGPLMVFTLLFNKASEIPLTYDINVKSIVELHIIGESLWSDVTRVFGSTIASLGRSMLPLKLVDSKSVGLSDFKKSFEVVKQTVMSAEGEAGLMELWVRIDMGKTKRTSILKNLKKLGGDSSFTMQFESKVFVPSANGNGDKKLLEKMVLFRFTPKLVDFFEIFEVGSGSLPKDILNLPHEIIHDPVAARKTNLVNSFYIIVTKTFVELVLDLFYLLMFIGTSISPYRFFKLIKCLLQHESYLPIEICGKTLDSLSHADFHVLEYRSALSPELNYFFKKYISQRLIYQETTYDQNICRILWNPFHYSYEHWNQDLISNFIKIENYYIESYRKLMKSISSDLSKYDGCEAFRGLVESRTVLYDELMTFWILKFSATISMIDPFIDNARSGLVRTIFSEEHDKVGRKLVANKILLENELKNMKSKAGTSAAERKGCMKSGILTRSLGATRKLVKLSFQQAFVDVGFILLFLVIIITLFRALPLLKDLAHYDSYSPMRYSTRHVLMKHGIEALRDIFYFCKLLLFFILILATVVTVPHYFQTFTSRMSSLCEAADYAQSEFSYFLYYICELFCFVFACRTYKLVVKATLYAFLVPAACLAEVLSFCACTASIKVWIGFIMWVALLAGSIVTTIYARSAGSSNSSLFSVTSNLSLLALCASLFGTMIMAAITVSGNPLYTSPNVRAIRAPGLTWSHLLAAFTGPLESLQLSAVVMFFFWNRIEFGSDSFSSTVMMWGVHGGYENGYLVSVAVACALVLFWAILVSVPLAESSSQSFRKREKILAFKNSPLYDFVIVCISRLFTVWIIATLMRSSSCLTFENQNVMSSSISTTCGGDASKVAVVSLPLLVYFMITSSILHSDDADVLEMSKSADVNFIKFSPLYALLVRAGQLFVCAACFSGFWTSNPTEVLIPIIVVCALLALLPICFRRNICSFEAIAPLRSGGWVCVLWTSIVCFIRTSGYSNNDIFASELSIYIGWVMIFILCGVLSVGIDYLASVKWTTQLQDSGMNIAVDKLLSACDKVLADDVIQGGSKKDATLSRIAQFRSEIRRARSPPQLARTLLALERLILVDRLATEFIRSRTVWVEKLELISNTEINDIVNDLSEPRRIASLEHVGSPIDAFAPADRDSLNWNRDSLNLNTQEDDRDMQLAIAASLDEANANANHIVITTGEEAHANNPNAPRRNFSPVFSNLILQMEQLSSGIQALPMSTFVSRNVISIMLSRKLPVDVCWLICSYCLNSKHMQDLLRLDGNTEVLFDVALDRNTRNYVCPAVPKLMEEDGTSYRKYYYSMIEFGAYFIHCKLPGIRAVELSND